MQTDRQAGRQAGMQTDAHSMHTDKDKSACIHTARLVVVVHFQTGNNTLCVSLSLSPVTVTVSLPPPSHSQEKTDLLTKWYPLP
jgi:hypothetical protein